MVDLRLLLRILFSAMTQKAVLVTGGAQGIGRAIAALLWAVAKCFGRLDALVNNTGLAGPQDPPIRAACSR